jgi:hypothetical protein
MASTARPTPITPDAELSLILLAIERARFDRRDSISWQGRNVRIHAAS